jgi:hypothetical protein
MKSGIPRNSDLPTGAVRRLNRPVLPYRRGRNGRVARAVGLVDHEEAHQRPAGP